MRKENKCFQKPYGEKIRFTKIEKKKNLYWIHVKIQSPREFINILSNESIIITFLPSAILDPCERLSETIWWKSASWAKDCWSRHQTCQISWKSLCSEGQKCCLCYFERKISFLIHMFLEKKKKEKKETKPI